MDQSGSIPQFFRPIRPRESPADGPATEPGPEEGKLKRASMACVECKRRRIRCSDGIPCAECAAHGRQCIYNELADKRRKVAAKHAQEELQYYRGFLDQLLQAVRHGDRTTVDGIIDIIRAGAPEDDVLRAVTHCLDQCPNAEATRAGKGTRTRAGDAFPGAGTRTGDMGLDILNENLMRDWEYGNWR